MAEQPKVDDKAGAVDDKAGSADDKTGSVEVDEATDEATDEAKSVRTTQPGAPSIFSELHPLLAAIPIGAWVTSFAFDIASHVSDSSRVYSWGAFWIIAIGLGGAVISAVPGLIERNRLASPQLRDDALRHAVLNVIAIALFVASMVVRRRGIDEIFNGTSTNAMVLSGLGLVVLGASLVLGARVRVARCAPAAEPTVREGRVTTLSRPPTVKR